MRHSLLPLLAAASMLLTACGVKFSDPAAHNEFFRSLIVTGNTRAGAPLTAAVSYQTTYGEALKLTCELRQGNATIKVIGQGETPAVAASSPKTMPPPVPGNFSYDFIVDNPGSYKVQCYTERDKDNFVTRALTVR